MKLNVVPAREGIAWVRAGMRTFFRQPLALAGLFFMYMALVMVAAMLPLIGPVLAGMLVPAATLGLMAATAEAQRGRFPMPSILFSAFRAGRERLRAMLVLGAAYTLGSMLATGLATLIAGAPPSGAEGVPINAATVLALALHLPLFLMFWHAPALVHWHGVTPAKSLFFSVVAVIRNFGAHLVYSLAWGAVFMVVGSVLGLVAGLVGGPTVAQAVMMPTALLLASMFSTSIYFSFQACFPQEAQAPELTPVTPSE